MVVVSHDTESLSTLCPRTLHLHQGTLVGAEASEQQP
jgi:ABC-type polysaccharide/polyol phosphate transport system ATPase subunit